MCDPWLLVNEFPFVQVTKLGPIKTHPEISSKHPLVALEGGKRIFIFAFNLYDISNMFFLIIWIVFKGIFIVKSPLKSLVLKIGLKKLAQQ